MKNFCNFFSIQKRVFWGPGWFLDLQGPWGPLWDPLLQAILAQNAHKMATLGPKKTAKKREKKIKKIFPLNHSQMGPGWVLGMKTA